MAFIREFGSYLPSRVVSNAEIGEMVGCNSEWIVSVSGISERRFAAEDETVVDLAVKAARDCLKRAGLKASELGLLLVSSGSWPRRFPGPAAMLAHRLGLDYTPAIDLPHASAGAIIGMSMAEKLASAYRHVLVVASERMSSVVLTEPMQRSISILFGDGAGACLISADGGEAEIDGSEICSDGAYADDLTLPLDGAMEMNGRSVIMHVTRKLPGVLRSVLERHGHKASEVDAFLLHQANSNIITRVADALAVPAERFYSNIDRYGNTSSASMLIAASEWIHEHGFHPGVPVAFGGFGAGFHWGALLAIGV